MKYIRNDAEIAAEKFDDGIVIINFITGRYFNLNTTGERIWELLESPVGVDEVVAGLLPAQLRGQQVFSEIDAFLRDLAQERLIVPAPVEVAGAQVMPVFVTEYEKPAYTVFDNLSELIQLDPIHDVNETQGWPAVSDAVPAAEKPE